MELYKRNGYQIVRLCLNQFGMTLFGLVLAMATSKNDTLLCASSIFSIIFYLYLLHTVMYELGQKDGIRIEAGRLSYFPMTGLVMALTANALNILLGILSFIGKVAYDADGSALWAEKLYAIANMIAKFIQGMYVGVLKVFLMDVSYANLLTPIPAIILCTFSYILGVKYCHGFGKKKEKQDRYSPSPLSKG